MSSAVRTFRASLTLSSFAQKWMKNIRGLVEHVAVDRRHLDVAGAQRADQGLTSLPVTRKCL
jgi:hypothetical protein